MDTTTAIGLGTSVAFYFSRYIWSTIPRAISVAGFVGGLVILAAGFLGLKPPHLAAVLFLIGLLFIGGAIHVLLGRQDGSGGNGKKPGANQVGDIPNNQGIVTQGQTGDNRLSK